MCEFGVSGQFAGAHRICSHRVGGGEDLFRRDKDLIQDDGHVSELENTGGTRLDEPALATRLVNLAVAGHVEVFDEVISRLTADLKLED